MSKRTPADAGRPQSQKFRELARELGCDDDEDRFNDLVKRIAKEHTEKQPKTRRDDDDSGE